MAEVIQDPPRDPQAPDPIINCHTHIFTADHVPPWLGKTFLPLFLPYLFSTPLIVVPARWWYRFGPRKWKHTYLYRLLRQWYYLVKITIDRIFLLWLIVFAAGVLLTVHVFFLLYDLLSRLSPSDKEGTINKIREWLERNHLLFPMENFWLDALLVFTLMVFFPSGRNIIFLIFKKIFSFIAALPDQSTRAYLARYWNIGRFAFYQDQGDIFRRLYDQYPEGTKFVILPMDMEYMAAGPTPKKYLEQMDELVVIKKNHKKVAYPFVFVDPRRIADPRQENYFRYSVDAAGKVVLEECLIRDWIENCHFSGFKIYPALGYFPFDKDLLPLWIYAVQKGLPILTHCIRGTIFYRGIKKSAWDYHLVFEQVMKKGKYDRLLLPEIRNSDFSNNFTHPLNYLCLLEDALLRKLVAKEEYKEVRPLFYDNGKFRNSLRDLKICLGHFGGEDEWQKYFELDRHDHSAQLTKHPLDGIDFFELADGTGESRGKIEQLWKDTDWYSIICSMMLKYDNIYADISYIIHDDEIIPLLQQTLKNPELRAKVLFGTDFYVVRNHKSEKEMLAEVMGRLSKEDFNQIARRNPKEFLENVWTRAEQI
jgi:predicted TIM-barrel fold metal-dependent hydrolase